MVPHLIYRQMSSCTDRSDSWPCCQGKNGMKNGSGVYGPKWTNPITDGPNGHRNMVLDMTVKNSSGQWTLRSQENCSGQCGHKRMVLVISAKGKKVLDATVT